MCKLSIVVSIYNIEKYISKCIDSLLKQNSLEYEVILVDDGSTDGSGKICKEYAKKYEHIIKYYYKTNGGLSSARNYGLDRSKGQYVLFFDGDDYLDKDTLDKVIVEIENNKLDIIQFGYREVNESGHIILEDNSSKTDTLKNYICNGNEFLEKNKLITMPWAYIFKKEFLLDNRLRFLEGIYHEDEEFTIRAIALSNRIMFFDKVIYNYVIRQGSIMRSVNIKKAYDLILVVDSLKEFINNRELDEEIYRYIYTRMNYLYTCSLDTASVQKGKLQEFLNSHDKKRVDEMVEFMIRSKNIKHIVIALCIKFKLYFLIEKFFSFRRG